jgi:hypothetical protein
MFQFQQLLSILIEAVLLFPSVRICEYPHIHHHYRFFYRHFYLTSKPNCHLIHHLVLHNLSSCHGVVKQLKLQTKNLNI